MKKVLVFAGSNSKKSINKELAVFTSELLTDKEIIVLDLNDYKLPIYGMDEEIKNGIPQKAKDFYKSIEDSDGIILSLAEHNGNFTAVFKNIYDWMSRIEQKLWQNKPMLLMATSPGGRGGATVLNIAKAGFKHMGGNVISDFSMPSFQKNFIEGKLINNELLEELTKQVKQFEEVL